MLEDIRAELERLNATDISVSLDPDFDPSVDEVLKVEHDQACWHFLPEHFMALIRDLPSGAGGSAVHRAIERRAPHVWHGKDPHGSRDA